MDQLPPLSNNRETAVPQLVCFPVQASLRFKHGLPIADVLLRFDDLRILRQYGTLEDPDETSESGAVKVQRDLSDAQKRSRLAPWSPCQCVLPPIWLPHHVKRELDGGLGNHLGGLNEKAARTVVSNGNVDDVRLDE